MLSAMMASALPAMSEAFRAASCHWALGRSASGTELKFRPSPTALSIFVMYQSGSALRIPARRSWPG
jgi:hypothetical protein